MDRDWACFAHDSCNDPIPHRVPMKRPSCMYGAVNSTLRRLGTLNLYLSASFNVISYLPLSSFSPMAIPLFRKTEIGKQWLLMTGSAFLFYQFIAPAAQPPENATPRFCITLSYFELALTQSSMNCDNAFITLTVVIAVSLKCFFK